MNAPDWDWLKKNIFVKPRVEASEDFVRAVMARVGDEASIQPRNTAQPSLPAWRVWAASAAMAGFAVFLAAYPTTAQALDGLLSVDDDVVAVVMEQ